VSLARTLARRQRKLRQPLVIARLYRIAAQLHGRRHGSTKPPCAGSCAT
jgi:hypothetical protein